MTQPEPLDVTVPAGEETPPPRRRRGRVLVPVVAVLALAAGGGAAYVATSFSGGGGTQPETALPADTLAAVVLDLDPSTSTKLDLFRLTKKFPAAAERLRSAESLRDDVLALAFEDADIDYDTAIKPWLGDRAALAAVPGAAGAEPDLVAAVAYTDRDTAQRGLRKANEGRDEVEFAFVGDYVLLSDSRAAVDRAAAATSRLSDDPTYQADIARLDGDPILRVWGDLGRSWDAVPADFREEFQEGFAAAASGALGEDPTFDPTGRVVLGLTVEPQALELTGRALDLDVGIDAFGGVDRSSTGLAGLLPAEALAAVSFSGFASGPQLVGQVDSLLSGVSEDLPAQLREADVDLARDLPVVFGKELGAAFWGTTEDPNVVVRTRGNDGRAAQNILRRLADVFGGQELARQVNAYTAALPDGLAAGTANAVRRAARPGATLASDPRFTAAVPDHATSWTVFFADVQQLLQVSGVAADEPNAKPLAAVGLSVTGESDDAVMRLRVTFR